jgi:hypothetical protein
VTDPSIDPTHAVVYGDLTAHPNRERCLTAEAIGTAAERADRLCVLLDDEGVAEAYPRIVGRLRERYDRIGETGEYREFVTEDPDDVGVVENLLRRPTWHLPVLVSHVRLERDGTTVVLYNSDHRQFDLDADAAPGCVEAVAATFEDAGAGILPRQSLCRWTREGTTYDLAPPSLCVDRTCFELTSLQDVVVAPDDLSIRLQWADRSTGSRIADLLGGVLGRLTSTPPRELAFERDEQFETASEEFERVVETIRS